MNISSENKFCFHCGKEYKYDNKSFTCAEYANKSDHFNNSDHYIHIAPLGWEHPNQSRVRYRFNHNDNKIIVEERYHASDNTFISYIFVGITLVFENKSSMITHANTFEEIQRKAITCINFK